MSPCPLSYSSRRFSVWGHITASITYFTLLNPTPPSPPPPPLVAFGPQPRARRPKSLRCPGSMACRPTAQRAKQWMSTRPPYCAFLAAGGRRVMIQRRWRARHDEETSAAAAGNAAEATPAASEPPPATYGGDGAADEPDKEGGVRAGNGSLSSFAGMSR